MAPAATSPSHLLILEETIKINEDKALWIYKCPCCQKQTVLLGGAVFFNSAEEMAQYDEQLAQDDEQTPAIEGFEGGNPTTYWCETCNPPSDDDMDVSE